MTNDQIFSICNAVRSELSWRVLSCGWPVASIYKARRNLGYMKDRVLRDFTLDESARLEAEIKKNLAGLGYEL